MIKLAADLHIHSCLSPCGEMEMTPNNLVNMAYIKGLQAIALCDHNTARNVPAAAAVAKERGLVFLPGLEVETKEEVHVLTLFAEVDAALRFGEWIYEHLPDVPNMPDFFGMQIAMDEDDTPIYTEERMLLQSTTLSLSEVAARCGALGGAFVPAHINRTSNSLLYNLGFLPTDIPFTTLEVYKSLPAANVELSNYHIVYNSDAHNLESISEPENYISACEQSAEGILAWLKSEKQPPYI